MKCIIKQIINTFGQTNREYIIIDITDDGKGVVSSRLEWSDVKEIIKDEHLQKVLSNDTGTLWTSDGFREFVNERPNLKEIIFSQLNKIE